MPGHTKYENVAHLFPAFDFIVLFSIYNIDQRQEGGVGNRQVGSAFLGVVDVYSWPWM